MQNKEEKMDNKYAKIAVKAFEYINAGYSAEKAWEKASCESYKKGSHSQKKGCPRNAFLGLTSNSQALAKSKNSLYALKALDILRKNPNSNFSINELWLLVVEKPKIHNSQMNIVLALWNNGLIC